MEGSIEENNMKFVLLIEEHKDALCKSQLPPIKKKKDEAILAVSKKWAEICGKSLTQSSLMKKISNVKTRSKSALQKKKPLTDWQTKMLELIVV